MRNVASLGLVWALFSVVNFSNAQELYDLNNATNINNEVNSKVGWFEYGLSTAELVSETDGNSNYSIVVTFGDGTGFRAAKTFIGGMIDGTGYLVKIRARSDINNTRSGHFFAWSGIQETINVPVTSTTYQEYVIPIVSNGSDLGITAYGSLGGDSFNKVYISSISVQEAQPNLALNKPTIQSSVYGGLTGDLAVDGNTNGDVHTHTQEDLNPFWRVDLQNTYNIGDVKIFNRSSSSQSVLDRLVGFKLYIGNTDSTNPNDYTEIMTLDGSIEQSSGNTGATGRYVMVYGAGLNEFLSLAEIEVYEATGSTDTQSPTAPILSSSGQTDTTVNLSWSGATDNVGVTGYNVYQDGSSVVTNISSTSHQVTGLTASATYDFTVIALDATGNQSIASNSVSVTMDSSSGSGSSGGSVWSESNSVASYTGDVAIGTSSVPAGYKMAVDGKLITEEVKVQLSGNWPDYVFEEGYDLPSLEEIQKHIKEKGHLPNIPPAKEVETNGIELGEMDKLLLKKIEELTLYVIELKKEIQRQQEEIDQINVEQ